MEDNLVLIHNKYGKELGLGPTAKILLDTVEIVYGKFFICKEDGPNLISISIIQKICFDKYVKPYLSHADICMGIVASAENYQIFDCPPDVMTYMYSIRAFDEASAIQEAVRRELDIINLTDEKYTATQDEKDPSIVHVYNRETNLWVHDEKWSAIVSWK